MRKNFGVKTYICPQPVLIISTYNEDGTSNAMNAAWGGMYDFDKVCIALSDHKTTDNLIRNKAFSISIGDEKNVVGCDYVGIVSGRKEPNKFSKAGFSSTKSDFVNAPVINELALALECEVVSLENEVLIGKIINVSCDEAYLGADGLPDISKLNPIIYEPIHHYYMNLGSIVGHAFSDGKKIK